MTFICIEGGDGSGKGTHARLLAEWLRGKGYQVHTTSEPTEGLIGKLIKRVLRGEADVDPHALALLFTADRYEHQREIKQALEEGDVVIADRYYLSTYAYQSAQGVDLEWMKSLHKGIIKPDIQIVLDVEPEVAKQRLRTREKFEQLEFMGKVREKYIALDEGFVISSASSEEDTQKEIRKTVEKFLNFRKGSQ